MTGQAKCIAGQFDLHGLPVLVRGLAGVQHPPGIDAIVGDADLLDFFEVEQPRAVRQGVQGHLADRWGMGVEDGQRDHGRRLQGVD